jgi:hypothetical protein
LGNVLLYRHSVGKEPFPDFISYKKNDPNSYCNRYVICSNRNHLKSVNPTTYRDAWADINNACGIEVQKVTHNPRVEVQNELSDIGLSGPIVERLCGYVANMGHSKMNVAQKNSYTLAPPTQGVCAVAGGDFKNSKSHSPPHSTVEASGELIHLFAPYYANARSIVSARIDFIRNSQPAAKAKVHLENERLYMADGALKAIRLRLTRALQLAACRPYDSTLTLQADALPYYIKFSKHPVYQLPGFKSNEFLAFTEIMKTTQDYAALHCISLPVHIRNEIERVHTEILLPPLQEQNRMLVAQQLQLNRIERTLQRMGTCNTPNSVGSLPLSLDTETVHNNLIDEPWEDELTKKGGVRKRKVKRDIMALIPGGAIWSPHLKTAHQFWGEFKYGLNGSTPLKELEDTYGPAWRSDTIVQKSSGVKTSALRTGWGKRAPIYSWIIHLMNDEHMSEARAVDDVQKIFEKHSNSMGNPKLGLISHEVRELLIANNIPTAYVRSP